MHVLLFCCVYCVVINVEVKMLLHCRAIHPSIINYKRVCNADSFTLEQLNRFSKEIKKKYIKKFIAYEVVGRISSKLKSFHHVLNKICLSI